MRPGAHLKKNTARRGFGRKGCRVANSTAGGNLLGMTFTEAERRLIAAGSRGTSCDQATYAAQHGISTRTLRGWVQRYGVGDRPVVRARAIVEGAIRQLQDLLAGLDAEAERRNGSGEVERAGGTPERQGASDARRTGDGTTSRGAPRPKPMPTGFFAGF
jgi:transposase-like protein